MVTWIRPLSTAAADGPEVLGGKGHGLVELMRLGLPVPAGFVVTTAACRAWLASGRLPDGLAAELAGAAAALPGRVSVRSGASVSMPGMMDTLLDVSPPLTQAVEAVFASWHTPRARTYRRLHDIPGDLGTAVVVQAMVHGDRDDRSGAGVAFSRDPNTGAPATYGEVVFGRRGDAVVAGDSLTEPLSALARRLPEVRAELRRALDLAETHFRDACHVEFTVESGRLWLLQVRAGGLVGRAAIRAAVDLADAGVISRAEAVRRVGPEHFRHARTPRLDAPAAVLARGRGAAPGVASGRVATTAGAAVRMAAAGPVILVRPTTSPLDVHGLAAAAGVVTFRGGPASHAAVVARAMGKPAVVGAPATGLEEGMLITIDGTSGEIAAGHLDPTVTAPDPAAGRLLSWAGG